MKSNINLELWNYLLKFNWLTEEYNARKHKRFLINDNLKTVCYGLESLFYKVQAVHGTAELPSPWSLLDGQEPRPYHRLVNQDLHLT